MGTQGSALEGRHDILPQLLWRACVHGPHPANLTQVQERLLLHWGGTEEGRVQQYE